MGSRTEGAVGRGVETERRSRGWKVRFPHFFPTVLFVFVAVEVIAEGHTCVCACALRGCPSR